MLLDSTTQLMESSYQPIIPGLPDDVALRCLAKITHGYHGYLETVSKRWRDVLHSTEYSSYKAKEGWSGDWVFLLTDNITNGQLFEFANDQVIVYDPVANQPIAYPKDQWIAYDPDADRWHPIPMIPRKEEYGWSEGFGCVCVGNRFLVIGGSYYRTVGGTEKPYITNQVFQFDTFTKKWSEAASMNTPRAYFGCCVMSGKVYVCGGRNMSHLDGLALAEVYDPLTNKWEELPRMRNKLMGCLSLSYNGNLYAFTDLHNNWCNDTLFGQYMIEIFDPSKQVWRTEQMNWPCSTYGQAEFQVTQDGRLYAYVHFHGYVNVVKRMENGEWHGVAQLPSMVGPPDGYAQKVFSRGFVALQGNELYVMGGLAYYSLGAKVECLSFDRCWIWNGKWRETRPLCRPFCGTVKRFAAFKEKKMSTT